MVQDVKASPEMRLAATKHFRNRGQRLSGKPIKRNDRETLFDAIADKVMGSVAFPPRFLGDRDFCA